MELLASVSDAVPQEVFSTQLADLRKDVMMLDALLGKFVPLRHLQQEAETVADESSTAEELAEEASKFTGALQPLDSLLQAVSSSIAGVNQAKKSKQTQEQKKLKEAAAKGKAKAAPGPGLKRAPSFSSASANTLFDLDFAKHGDYFSR